MIRIPAWFIAAPWRFIGLVVALLLSQWALFRAEVVFTGISGFPTLDTQNISDATTGVAQIRSYTPQAVQAYELFAVIDYVFPLVASLFLAASVLWLLRVANAATSWRIPEWISLLCLLPAVFDYVENVFLAGAVASDGSDVFVALALGAKALKLAALGLSSGLLAAALLYTVVMVVRRSARGASLRAAARRDES